MAGGVEMILTSSKILNISDETDMFILSRHLFWPSKGSLWSRSINSFWYLPIADLSKDLLTSCFLLTYILTKSIIIFSSKVEISKRSTYLNSPCIFWICLGQIKKFRSNVKWQMRSQVFRSKFPQYCKMEFQSAI